jgi:hypothetical protein
VKLRAQARQRKRRLRQQRQVGRPARGRSSTRPNGRSSTVDAPAAQVGADAGGCDVLDLELELVARLTRVADRHPFQAEQLTRRFDHLRLRCHPVPAELGSDRCEALERRRQVGDDLLGDDLRRRQAGCVVERLVLHVRPDVEVEARTGGHLLLCPTLRASAARPRVPCDIASALRAKRERSGRAPLPSLSPRSRSALALSVGLGPLWSPSKRDLPMSPSATCHSQGLP